MYFQSAIYTTSMYFFLLSSISKYLRELNITNYNMLLLKLIALRHLMVFGMSDFPHSHPNTALIFFLKKVSEM